MRYTAFADIAARLENLALAVGHVTPRPVPSASMNILQMHTDHPNRNNLPPQQMNDMTFVEPLP